jgi:outer membrane lipoprotein-sorting protein
MRKFAGWVIATGLVVGLVAGCGITPSKHNMVSKLQSEANKLDDQNYKSTAMMTVQMDNNSQTYYIETWFESPDVYLIKLGDANKHINQIIVHNKNGMFIVSPSLQKVFRFNGNWAQNQGHIYLYDQILQQIVDSKDLKMTKSGGQYTFTMPITPANDVVVKERVDIDSSTLGPKKVVLIDKDNTEVVTLEFKSFEKNVKYTTSDFDPQKLIAANSNPNDSKTTMANTEFGVIEPNQTFGATLASEDTEDPESPLLRFTGENAFTLQEFRPVRGVLGLPQAEVVDLYGVPAVFTGTKDTHQLIWVNNGIEFALTSSKLSLDQLKQVAISTMGQVGK